MKRTLLLITSLILCIFLACSCATSTDETAKPMTESAKDTASYDTEETAVEEETNTSSSEGLGSLNGNIVTDSDRKLVYTANYDIQTENYQEDYDSIISSAAKYNGYISSEKSHGTEAEQYGDSGRYSEMTIKIPVENYTRFTAELSGIGYITDKSQSVDDITSEYMDTESRITLLETRYQKLDEHLKSATKMEDIIELEDEMTQILYELESLKGEKRGYDNLVTYSTINLTLDEVVEIKEVPVSKESFWDKASDGFSNTMAGIGAFFESIGVFLISAFPVLVILAVLAVILVIIIKLVKKHNAKRAEKERLIQESKLIEIAKIEKTDDNILCVYPRNTEYPCIHRSAMAVYWNDEQKCLYHLNGQSWTLEQWYTQMLKAIGKEYDNTLLISPETEWLNLNDAERSRIMGAEQYVYTKK